MRKIIYINHALKFLQEFNNNINTQLDEFKQSLGPAANNGMGKRIDKFQAEIAEMQAKMDSNFATFRDKCSNDAMEVDKILQKKENYLRNELTSLKQESDQDFVAMHKRLDAMEDLLERGP